MPVYFIEATSSGHIKIGYSDDPINRLRYLQTSHAEKLQLACVINGDRYHEKFLHRICKSAHIRGEWFRPTEQVLKAMKGEYEYEAFPSDISKEDRPVNHVTELRERLGLSQREFAELLGVHQTAVSQWELGGNISSMARKALEWLKQEAA